MFSLRNKDKASKAATNMVREKKSRLLPVFGLIVSLLIGAEAFYAIIPWLAEKPEQIKDLRADGTKNEPFDVVLITDASGQTKYIGKDMAAGFQDAIARNDVTNDVRLIVRDDKGSAEATAAIASGSAAGFRTLALVGPNEQEGFNSVRDAANENEVVALVPIGNPMKQENGEWVFSLQASTHKNGMVLGRMLQRVASDATVVQFAHGDGTTDGLWNGLLESYAGSGIEAIDRVDWNKEASPKEIAENIAHNTWHDVVIISLPMEESEVVLRALREYGYAGLIVVEGESSLEFFAQRFKADRSEILKEGYFTNGVISLVPFTPSIANEKSQRLISNYRNTNQGDPSWAYAYGYDAGLLIANFLQDSKATGSFNLGNPDFMRAELKKYLSNLHLSEETIVGFTGPLDFKEKNIRDLSPKLVIYNERKQKPYFVQLSDTPTLIRDTKDSSDFIRIGDYGYRVVPVVHVGINPKSFSGINLDLGVYDGVFDIWFKSKNQIDIADIQFLNLVGDLKSAVITEEKKSSTEIYRRYLVNGVFRFDPKPSDLVLDQINLPILFRHRNLDYSELRFVTDPEIFYISQAVARSADQENSEISAQGFNIRSLFLAVDERQIKALGDSRGSHGVINYSVGTFQINLQRSISTATSHIVRAFNTELLIQIFIISSILLLAISLLWILRPIKLFEGLYHAVFLATAMLSETILFTLPLTSKLGVESLAFIRISFNLIFIMISVRLVDIVLMSFFLKRNKQAKKVQPVILFFVRIGLYFAGIAIFYMGVLGRDLLPILATASVLLTVIGLALRELIFDSVAGIAIAADENMRVGQWITLRAKDQNLTGVVLELGWRFVTIRSRNDQVHYIPNSIFATQILSNMSNNNGYTRIEVPFLMSARADINVVFPKLVEAVSLKLANDTSVDHSRPFRIVIDGLEDECIKCLVQIYYSPEVGTDTLRTRVLEEIRLVLVKEDSLSIGLPVRKFKMNAFPG